MFTKHLQEYLDKFTDGKKGNAISNSRIYIEMPDGKLQEIRRIEVWESNIIGDSSVMVVVKPHKDQKTDIISPSFRKT